jgi:hypothetical protein
MVMLIIWSWKNIFYIQVMNMSNGGQYVILDYTIKCQKVKICGFDRKMVLS